MRRSTVLSLLLQKGFPAIDNATEVNLQPKTFVSMIMNRYLLNTAKGSKEKKLSRYLKNQHPGYIFRATVYELIFALHIDALFGCCDV